MLYLCRGTSVSCATSSTTIYKQLKQHTASQSLTLINIRYDQNIVSAFSDCILNCHSVAFHTEFDMDRYFVFECANI